MELKRNGKLKEIDFVFINEEIISKRLGFLPNKDDVENHFSEKSISNLLP